MNICICGGGALGHVCAAILSSPYNSISILTGQPEKWNKNICITDNSGQVLHGKLEHVSSNPSEVIPNTDIIILCLPGFLIEKELKAIKPYLNKKTIIGSIVSSTGFFFSAHSILSPNCKLFGFQRVPYIARVREYGKNANLLGYKKQLHIAVENITDKEAFRNWIETAFGTPTDLLDNFYEASLSNSNPILHTGRLYSMWHDWDGTPYPNCTLFYNEWTDKASEILIAMDKEFHDLLKQLPVRAHAVPSLLDYYESNDSHSLSEKLKSIEAFKTIPAPMQETKNGWIPDFQSRYFTEDFPYGLRFIKELAQQHNIKTPVIDKVYEWGISCINNR